jgi:hypothetical protein
MESLRKCALTCAAGTKYRVYDTTFAGDRHELRTIDDPAATARIFVPNGGMKRSYTFKRSNSRVLEQALERQVREASYLTTEPFDARTLPPAARPR